MFTNLQEFFDWLSSQNKFSVKLHMTRIERACEKLGNPQLSLKTIHIAGTNGKGSTCNYLAYLLQEHGLKVGLYISPYIICFNERIQINNEYISDEDLLECVNEIMPVIKATEKELDDDMTEFEIITLISFVYFKKKQVDYAVYEVGMGGRYDATNVILPISSGITNIAWDHMNILGDTLEKIGYEKIGIAKKGVNVFTTEENPSVLQVFADYSNKVSANLVKVDLNDAQNVLMNDEGITFTYRPLAKEIFIPMFGLHQVKNALLALKVYEDVVKIGKLPPDFEYIYNGMKKAKWAGRLEVISKKPFIILDGSHNIDGVTTLVEALKYYVNKGIKIKMVFTAMKDKETSKMMVLLQSVAAHMTITSFNYYRAASARYLFDQTDKINKDCVDDYRDAIEEGIQNLKEDELLLITGSLYFVSEVKQYFKKR